MIVHNVIDRRRGWIGPWEVEEETIDTARLWAGDEGRTVIYQDSCGRAEAGTLSSWVVGDGGENLGTVWARFSQGDTAAACCPDDLRFAVRDASGDFYRPPVGTLGWE